VGDKRKSRRVVASRVIEYFCIAHDVVPTTRRP
jgi:hypothetical protein